MALFQLLALCVSVLLVDFIAIRVFGNLQPSGVKQCL